MNSNVWVDMVSLTTSITIIIALIYAILWMVKLITSKLAVKINNKKLIELDNNLMKLNQVVRKLVIVIWLILVIMKMIESLPEIVKLIKLQLGEKMDLINALHSIMQVVLVLVVIVCLAGIGFLLKLKYNESKAQDEDTSDMY